MIITNYTEKQKAIKISFLHVNHFNGMAKLPSDERSRDGHCFFMKYNFYWATISLN